MRISAKRCKDSKDMQRDVGRNIETKQGTAIKAFWEEKQGDKKREVGISNIGQRMN